MKGWILDLYPGRPGEMVVWLKDEKGEAVRLVDHWAPSFYIAADDFADLGPPLGLVGRELAWTRTVQKQERITDREKSEVLEAKVKDAKKVQQLARRVERLGPFGTYRLYNVDLPPNQSYLYERDLFPLAYCEVSSSGGKLKWELQDNVMDCKYRLPDLKKLSVDVAISKLGRIQRDTDKIKEIRLKNGIDERVIEGASEAENILELVRAVKELDPDFVTTRDGDAFLLPYLIKRAEVSGVADLLTLDRDGTILRLPAKKGTSFFSYGKIQYKPSAVKLYGRIHVDTSNSFSYSEAGFHGLLELSRICRMPLQTASRASIGKALSSIQFYEAFKMDLLIPWKPTLAERFKDRAELLAADRGGFIFEPKIGLHEGIGELDFSSLYPNIMYKKNISAETVRCPCCPDSKNRVPELGWNVCERRTGIVPTAMKIIVEKRLKYKELKRGSTGAEHEKYDQRQAALKWLGVTCLPKESYVFVRSQGTERCVKIGEFIDGLVGDRDGAIACTTEVLVAGIGPDMKAKYCRVGQLVKQRNEQKLLRIKMEDGREVEATPDHPFFTLQDSELVVKVASELRPGEMIPIAKRIPSLPSSEVTLDLIERLDEILSHRERLLWRLSGEPVRAAALRNRESLIRAAVSEGYSYQAARLWTRSGIVPFRFLALLGIDLSQHRGLRIGTGRREGGRVAWIPATLEIGESLGFFLGLYVADGSAGRNSVRIDIGQKEPDLLENARRIVVDLFRVQPRVYKERNARMFVLQVDSASLVRVLEKIFALPGSSENGKLKVPELIFNSTEDVAQGFIEGMIAGDGSASRARPFVNIATKSKELLDQLAFLSTKLGLTFRLGGNLSNRPSLYAINFTGPETLSRIASWGFLKDVHRELVTSHAKDCGLACSHPVYARLPAEESGLYKLTRATRTSSEPHVRRGSSMCPVVIDAKIARVKTRKLSQQQVELTEKIEGFVKGDLGFVRIVDIIEQDSKSEYVYCFQLEENEVAGFFAGRGAVLVHNCFGYLGFNNAKFGRIDAHIAVCAWDRKILVDAARVAERRGYEVIHGIVDSLWLKKDGADDRDYLELKAEMERETGFTLSFEGIYKWIAFLPSKVDAGLPVLNRYFGAYRSGALKVRGIEARRHDTPPLFKKCQIEMLRILAKADSVGEAKEVLPQCVDVFLKYARVIEGREAPADDVAFAMNLSKRPDEYVNRTLQSSVARQLAEEGVDLHAGEGVRYVIRDYQSRGSKRAVPADFNEESARYDSRRYIRLLAEACASVLNEFDGRCNSDWLVGRRTSNHLLGGVDQR